LSMSRSTPARSKRRMPVVVARTHIPARRSSRATRSHAASSSRVHGFGRLRPLRASRGMPARRTLGHTAQCANPGGSPGRDAGAWRRCRPSSCAHCPVRGHSPGDRRLRGSRTPGGRPCRPPVPSVRTGLRRCLARRAEAALKHF
jgi:hypothetical protein